jgi:hypothetical protein
MARLRLVADDDVPLHVLADRLREVGHWVPPDALEQAVDAALQAAPPALATTVRTHLRSLGCDDGPEECAMFAGLLEVFVERAPEALVRIEAAVDARDAVATATAAGRLARQAAALGARPLAALCGHVVRRAGAGDLDLPGTVRAAIRSELAVTCRVLAGFAAELVERRRPAQPRHPTEPVPVLV